MIIHHGIPAQFTAQAAALYWGAFGPKLRIPMGPEAKALAFVCRVLGHDHAICAIEDGALLGVVGFKTPDGALVGGTFNDLRAIYGLPSALLRACILGLLERDTDNERFLMDGIFVAQSARGRGVGTALLHAVIAEARSRGYPQIRLDVIDTNPRARALYAREGFSAVQTTQLGPLRHIFGFRQSTTMVRSTGLA